MTVPNLMLKVFCYQDLRREGGGEQIGLNPLGHDQTKIPKGYDKITRFLSGPLWIWFVFIPVGIMRAFEEYDIELNDILTNPTDFY